MGEGEKGLKMCGQGRGELSNKSFSLKRITDDDGLRVGGGLRWRYIWLDSKKQIQLDKFYTFYTDTLAENLSSPIEHVQNISLKLFWNGDNWLKKRT